MFLVQVPNGYDNLYYIGTLTTSLFLFYVICIYFYFILCCSLKNTIVLDIAKLTKILL